jgi:acyl-coenzyme A thioesterase PaaI-like protein
MMESQIIVENRYCGPLNNGNGGYTCGLLANSIEGAAEVTLRHPPPINVPMTVKHEIDRLALYSENVLIAEAIEAELDMIPPNPPTLEAAKISTMKEEDVPGHYFPNCFVCGTERAVGDGLRIFPGPVKGENYIAAVWIPDPSLSDQTGFIKDEVIWAALDCPGGWAILSRKMRFIILGRLAVQILRKITPGEECIVMGWTLSEAGRKLSAGTAIYSADGRLVAKGKATWIELRQT